MEKSASPCCSVAPATVSNYKPKGKNVLDKVKKSHDLVIYEAPYDVKQPPKKLIICCYDIFGFHANTKEVCDNLAIASGCRVIMPDFYRGDYWNEERSIHLMYSWVTYNGNWNLTVKEDVLNIIEHYKQDEGITSIGIFGFCWGGKISCLAGIELKDEIKAAGLIHPSGVMIGEADRINCPVILVPSKDEINFFPFRNKVQERLGEDAAEHYRYDNMAHGFMAARGNFDNLETRKAVDEIIQHLARFFNKHL